VEKQLTMSDNIELALSETMKIDGALGASLANWREIVVLGTEGLPEMSSLALGMCVSLRNKWDRLAGKPEASAAAEALPALDEADALDWDSPAPRPRTLPPAAAAARAPEEPQISDVLITLENQLHVVRPLKAKPEVFLLVVLSKAKGNIGMARLRIDAIEKKLTLA
jgi:hypothetical protein